MSVQGRMWLFVIGVTLGLVLAPGPVAWAQEVEQQASAPDSAGLETAEGLVAEVETGVDSLSRIAALGRGQDETRRASLRWQATRLVDDIEARQNKLADLILDSRATGVPLEDISRRFESTLDVEHRIYANLQTRWSREIDALRDQRRSTASEDLGDLEIRIDEARGLLDQLYSQDLRVLTLQDSVGSVRPSRWEGYDRALRDRAETLVGRLQLATGERDRLQSRAAVPLGGGSGGGDTSPIRVQLEQAKRRVSGIAKSLSVMADLMRRRGMETAQYRQFVIQATGEITTNILDPQVLGGLIQDVAKSIWTWLSENVPGFLVKLGIVFVFVFLFQMGFRLSWWLLRHTGLSSLSHLMQDLVGRLIRPIASLLGLFFGLLFIGIDATTLLAGAGVLGVIVGLALQDSLSNIAAGVFILLTRPFDVDDVVRGAGEVGKVRMLGLANTTIVTFDGRRLMIPNKRIWGEVIENRSVEPLRRVDVSIKIPYGEDIDRVLGILSEVVRQDPRVLEDPAPQVFVKDLAESGADVAVWPWVRNEDWWPLLSALPRMLRLRLREEGIDVAYPRRDLRISDGSAGLTEPSRSDD